MFGGGWLGACVFLFLLLLFSYTLKHSWWWGCSRAERERLLCATQDLGESCYPFSLTWRYKWDRQNILHLPSIIPASPRFPRLLVSLRLPEDSCSWGTQGLPEALAARGCSWSGVGEQRAGAGHPPPPPPACRHSSQPGSAEGTLPLGLTPLTLPGVCKPKLCPNGKGNPSNSQAKLRNTNDKTENHTGGVYFSWWSSWAYLGDTLNGMFAVCSSVSESCCRLFSLWMWFRCSASINFFVQSFKVIQISVLKWGLRLILQQM